MFKYSIKQDVGINELFVGFSEWCKSNPLNIQNLAHEKIPTWNKGMKFDFVPKSDSHKENMRKAWIKRKREGKTIQEKTYIASLEKRRANSKRYDFIHDSGIIEYNLTVTEMSKKYQSQNLHPSNLRKCFGCSTKGYNKTKGWRILTGEPEYKKPRKTDKRTLSKLYNEK